MPINNLQPAHLNDHDFVDLEAARDNFPSNLRHRAARNTGLTTAGLTTAGLTVASLGQNSGFVGIDRLTQAREMRLYPPRSIAAAVAGLATYLTASVVVLSAMVPVFKACMLREKNFYPVALAVLAYKYLQPERFNALLQNQVLPMLMGARVMAVLPNQDSRAKLAFVILASVIVASRSAGRQAEENYGLYPAVGEGGLGGVDSSELDWIERVFGEDGLLNRTANLLFSTVSTVQIEYGLLKSLVQLFDRWTGRVQRPDGESLQIIQDVESASPLSEQIQSWKQVLLPSQQGHIQDDVWRAFSRHEGGPVFSSFLAKLYSGFPQDGVVIPGIQSRPCFARDRLRPLLLTMQSDTEFAHRVFAMADAGLGACTDRPPLTFIDMELEAKIHSSLKALGQSVSTDTSPHVREVLRCEFQKLNKQRAISHVRSQIRGLQNGGGNLQREREIIEDVMAVYQAIQTELPEYFPNLPYRKFGSNLDSVQIHQLSTNVQNELTTFWSDPCPDEAVQHLLASDSWRAVLQALTGKDTTQLREQFISKIDTRLDQLTDWASEGVISEKEYASALLHLQAERSKGLADLYNTPEFLNLTHRLIAEAR